MATVTQAVAGNLFKYLYSPEDIQDLCNLASIVLDRCAAKGTGVLGGKGFYGPVRTRSAEGHAYIAEDGDLPDAQSSTVDTWLANPVVQAGQVQMTGLAQDLSSTTAGAFATVFAENTQSVIQAMMAYREGAFFRDGSGLLGTFSADTMDGASTGPFTLDDVSFLREGMSVLVNDVSSPTTYFGPYIVTRVDWAAKAFYTSTAISATATTTDTLYINDGQTAGVAPVSREPYGLEAALLDTGSYLGISRATEGNWRASQETVSGFLDEIVLTRHRTRILQETGLTISGMGDFGLVCHNMQADRLFQIALPRIRFSGTDMISLLSGDQVKLGNIAVYASYQCPTSKAYLGEWSHFRTLYTPNGELQIDTDDEGPLKWVQGKDTKAVYMRTYHQFVCNRPNAFARMTSLSELSR